MPQFTFTVSDENGQRSSGVITAPDDVLAMKTLTEKEFMVLKIAPFKSKTNLFNNGFLGFGRHRLRGEELLAFSQELGVMLNAGISLKSAIHVINTDTKHPVLQELTNEISTGLDAGNSLSDLLQKFPKVFSNMYISLVRAGETGGRLPAILLRLANYIQRAENLKKKVQTALYYPLTVLAFGIIILSLITIFGVPHMKSIYDSLGAELPIFTRLFLGLGEIMSHNWIILLLLAVLGVLILKYMAGTETGKLFIDKIKLDFIILGSLYRRLIIARFAVGLSTLYASGVSIVHAMELVAGSLENKIMEKMVLNAAQKIYEGLSFIEPLRQSKMFPEMALSMIAAGEESGSLDIMLAELSTYYEDQVNIELQALTSLFEPLVMIFIGVGIGTVILALALPLMNLGGIMH